MSWLLNQEIEAFHGSTFGLSYSSGRDKEHMPKGAGFNRRIGDMFQENLEKQAFCRGLSLSCQKC